MVRSESPFNTDTLSVDHCGVWKFWSWVHPRPQPQLLTIIQYDGMKTTSASITDFMQNYTAWQSKWVLHNRDALILTKVTITII